MGSLALALETPGSDVDLVRFSQTGRNAPICEALPPCRALPFAEVCYPLARTSSRCSDCSEEGQASDGFFFLLCIGTRIP